MVTYDGGYHLDSASGHVNLSAQATLSGGNCFDRAEFDGCVPYQNDMCFNSFESSIAELGKKVLIICAKEKQSP